MVSEVPQLIMVGKRGEIHDDRSMVGSPPVMEGPGRFLLGQQPAVAINVKALPLSTYLRQLALYPTVSAGSPNRSTVWGHEAVN